MAETTTRPDLDALSKKIYPEPEEVRSLLAYTRALEDKAQAVCDAYDTASRIGKWPPLWDALDALRAVMEYHQ